MLPRRMSGDVKRSGKG